MRTHSARLVAMSAGALVASLLAPDDGWSQAPTVSLPGSLILPNYDRVPVGQREGIEAGAFVARTDDAVASWYNPAGLVQSEGSAVNASANAYEWMRISLEGLGETTGRSRLSSIGTLFAAVIGKPVITSDRWRIGFSLARPVNWQPSRIDALFVIPTSLGPTNVAYGTSVYLSSLVPGVAVGYAPAGRASRLRYGAGLSLSFTTLSQNGGLAGRFVGTDAASIAERNYATEGTVGHALLIGGVQWDATSRLALGARVVSPGIKFTGTTTLAYQETRTSPAGLTDLTFRDKEGDFDYKLPFEIDAGAALHFSRGSIEADVRYHASASRYEMFKSSEAGQLIESPSGTAPTVTPASFVTTFNSARAVANFAVGGNYALSKTFRLNVGVATDRSPVEHEDSSAFRAVNLVRGTAGTSFTWRRFSGSLGLGYATGRGSKASAGQAEDGTPVETRLMVKALNLLYALSLTF
jgi:long-subunit fatty acid transport protein